MILYPGAVLGAGNPKANGQYIRDLVEGRVPGMVLEDSALTWVHVNDVVEAIVRALEKEGNEGEEYLVGRHALTMGELTHLVCEISGAPRPKVSVPDRMVMAGAMLLTKVADLSGRPPLLGMSTDTMRNLKEGAVFDGSKAERELRAKHNLHPDPPSYRGGGGHFPPEISPYHRRTSENTTSTHSGE